MANGKKGRRGGNMFRRFMAGRNGPDYLSLGVMILALIMSIIPGIAFRIVSLLLMGYALFRIFSKNVYKRQAENYKFYSFIKSFIDKIKMWGYRVKNRIAQRKTYRFYKCPECKQKVRVPKGKGKISITCPKCGTKFVKKT